jgi:hypothetical protein
MDDADPRASDEFARHAQTYHRFMLTLKWLLISGASLVMFLALYFATTASFLGALVVGLLIFSAGAWAMHHGLSHSSEAESAAPVPVAEMERRRAH